MDKILKVYIAVNKSILLEQLINKMNASNNIRLTLETHLKKLNPINDQELIKKTKDVIDYLNNLHLQMKEEHSHLEELSKELGTIAENKLVPSELDLNIKYEAWQKCIDKIISICRSYLEKIEEAKLVKSEVENRLSKKNFYSVPVPLCESDQDKKQK